MARIIYSIYIGFSALNLLLLLIGGMPLFDALCTMFGTAGTGGFAIKPDSLASYSTFVQVVSVVFMVVFSISFSLHYLLLRGEWKAVLKDEEFRLYFSIMLVGVVLVTLNILPTYPSVWQGISHGAFTVISIITSTAFSTVNFDLWPQFARAALLILMITGAMAGSTGGGIKTSRVLILLKSFKASGHRLLHPRSVKNVRVNGKTVEESVVHGVYLFVALYAAIALLCFLLVSLDNMPLETNISAVLACINNIGPGFGLVGPIANFSGYSHFAKGVFGFCMLLGRLEIFPILLLFSPATWRKKT